MSIEADFTPPSVSTEAASDPQETSFPLSTHLNIVFSAYEDRMLVHSRRVNREPVNVLLTRRMTIIVLAQLLAHLPELSGLDKTPAQYWQEVLQMAHQTALESGRNAQEEETEQGDATAVGGPGTADSGGAPDAGGAGGAVGDMDGAGHSDTGVAAGAGAGAAARVAVGDTAAGHAKDSEASSLPESESETQEFSAQPRKLEGAIYLATSLTMLPQEGQLIMALTGLPMPCAMTEPCEREPLFAIPLQVEHVHQLIQLLIDRAREADWHLPLNLPWLESPSDAPATTLGLLH